MFDFTNHIFHSAVGEWVLYILLTLLIVALIVWIVISIYVALRSSSRYEPLKEKDKEEFYFVIKRALYKATQAYENGEPLLDSQTDNKPNKPEAKSKLKAKETSLVDKAKKKLKKGKNGDFQFSKRTTNARRR